MTTINGTDQISASRAVINANFALCAPLDNPTFTSATATKVTIQGTGGQGATRLQEWQDSSTTPLAYVTANGNIIGTILGAVSPTAGYGYVRMQANSNASTGFVEWKKGDNTRLGYMGGDSANVTLGLENSAKFVVTGGPIVIPTGTPASASAAGVAGQIAWDASYVYVCTATNTWKRAAIAAW